MFLPVFSAHFLFLVPAVSHTSIHNRHPLIPSHRISLPRHMVHTGGEDEEGGAAMKTCLSTDQLEVDVDASSDVSSELSFGYEFAQAEVMIKGNGESS